MALYPPYVIERTSRGERSYDIFSRLLMDRIVFLGTEINDDVANIVIAQRGGVPLRISDIGADGNNDGIKMSGVWDLIVSNCTIERWGTRGGSADTPAP